jgi:DNA primase
LSHLGEQADLSSADGKAKLVALAWPLISIVPVGVFQELLLERLGSLVGMSAARLRELRAATERPVAATTAPRPPATASDTRREPPRIGRGSLVTQAIQIALHFPAAVAAISPEILRRFAAVEQPGTATLHELLELLRAQPQAGTGVVLERWRERPESRRLAELASAECLIADETAAIRELAEILGRLSEQISRQRLDELITRIAANPTGEELQEYQRLINSLSGGGKA